MPLLSASLDTLLFTTLAVIPPLVYLLRRPASSSMPRPPLRSALSGLLILHTLYTLYTLIIDYPPNIFTALHIPLTTPADRIRAILLAHAGRTPGQPGAVLPPALESLLTRLASFDMRTIYVRCVPPYVRAPPLVSNAAFHPHPAMVNEPSNLAPTVVRTRTSPFTSSHPRSSNTSKLLLSSVHSRCVVRVVQGGVCFRLVFSPQRRPSRRIGFSQSELIYLGTDVMLPM